MGTELTGKRLQLLAETLPRLARLAVLWSSPTSHLTQYQAKVIDDLRVTASGMSIELKILSVRTLAELSNAFKDIARAHVEALYVVDSALFYGHRKELAALALQARLPATYRTKTFVQDGGLMSYGADFADQARRAAGYVDKILRGAKPGDLPIEQASKLEFVINLRTARALGLTIPQSMLTRADEIIK